MISKYIQPDWISKVWLFGSGSLMSLEENINLFISDKDVIDIKLSADDGYFTAMVIYKEILK